MLPATELADSGCEHAEGAPRAFDSRTTVAALQAVLELPLVPSVVFPRAVCSTDDAPASPVMVAKAPCMRPPRILTAASAFFSAKSASPGDMMLASIAFVRVPDDFAGAGVSSLCLRGFMESKTLPAMNSFLSRSSTP